MSNARETQNARGDERKRGGPNAPYLYPLYSAAREDLRGIAEPCLMFMRYQRTRPSFRGVPAKSSRILLVCIFDLAHFPITNDNEPRAIARDEN